MRPNYYVREHFIDYEFVKEFLAFTYSYYDVPISGVLDVNGHYYIFDVEEFPENRPNGKKDSDGDEDYDFHTGKYKITPISKINAYFRILSHCWFKFCVYAKGYGKIRENRSPKLVKFADKFARMKPDWIHKFTLKMYDGGRYVSRYEETITL